MNNSLFDDLSRSLGKASSRRQALRTILGVTVTGTLAWIGMGCDNNDEDSSPTPGGNNSEPLTYEIATPDQVQTLLTDAQQNKNYKFLNEMFKESKYQLGNSEGIIITREGEPTTKALVTHYAVPSSNDEVFLAYGINDQENPIVYSLKYNATLKKSVGLYRNIKGITAVDFQENLNSGGKVSQKVRTASSSVSDTSACKICTETCQETNKLRQGACAVAAIGTSIRLGFALKGSWKLIADPDGTLKEAADARSHMSAIEKAAKLIDRCKDGDEFDCGEGNSMCKDICIGCNEAGGAACGGKDVCHNGDCLKYCNDDFCHPLEVCKDGMCIAADQSCSPINPYMDIYLFGNRQAPVCCPIAGGINCGANVNGGWGGCCPPTTVCIPEGIGYGCCIVGSDPAKRC